MRLRAVVFDTFGTVVDWRGSVVRQAARFFAPRGIERDWDAFARAWRAGYRPAMQKVREGSRPWTRLDVLHRERLVEVLASFAVEGLTEAEIDGLNLVWHRLDPWPDAVPGLLRLRRRHLIGPLSNGNVTLLAGMAKRAGLPWDMLFASDVFRHYKPDPETYLGVVELLGTAPEEVMMCAAHNEDLAAARRHGLRTAFVRRPLEYGAGQERDLEPAEDWDILADSIEEVAEALGC